MKNLINLHLIETDEGLFKFSVLLDNIVFTDGICHNDLQATIDAAINLVDFIKNHALTTIPKIKDWEQ